LIYTCQPRQDSSGDYQLPAGTSSFSSSVTYRHSVSMNSLWTLFIRTNKWQTQMLCKYSNRKYC